MYSRKKSLGDEIFKSNSDKNPSFSSTLLDEIYRSIDENEEMQPRAEKVGNEEMVDLRRAHLVEKWMDKKKVEEKNYTKRPPLIPDYFEKDQQQSSQDNDPMFFSSTSNSSLSSSGVLSSSSDTEYFAAVEKTKTSCFFGPSWPKPIRTKVPIPVSSVSVSHERKKTEDSLKSRLDSVKVYENLKNLKQPISPGVRLSNFINSIFANGSSKKVRNRSKAWNNKKHSVLVESEQNWCPFEPKLAKKSVCSSASSFSRSILCNSPSTTSTSTNASKGKSNQEFSTRKVSFDPVSVVVDGEKGLKMEDSKVYQDRKEDDFAVEGDESGGDDNDDDDDEEGSDCSSELFEIDHLALFGKKRFCEDLPVYETTDLVKNLAIARGMMR